LHYGQILIGNYNVLWNIYAHVLMYYRCIEVGPKQVLMIVLECMDSCQNLDCCIANGGQQLLHVPSL
jgi:hypothetical protein